MKKRRNCHEKFAPIVNTWLLPIIIVAPVVPASALTVSAKLFSAYLISHNPLPFSPGRRCRFNAMTLGYPAILSHVLSHLSLFPYLGSLKTTFALPIPFTAVLYHTISALVTRLAPVIPKHRLVRIVGSLTIPRLLAAAGTEQRYVTIVLDATLSASWLALLVGTASFGFTMESTIAAPVYPHTHSQFTEAAVFRCVLHAHLLLSPFSTKSLFNYPHS